MASFDRFLVAINKSGGPLCDDCIAQIAGWENRRSARSAGIELQQEGEVVRTKGQCARCGRHKTVSHLAGGVTSVPLLSAGPKAASVPLPDDRPWFWEGNIQAATAAYLAAQGYHLRQVIDTASKAAGTDIMAERQGRELWVTVKGYPGGTARTTSSTQARHWFSGAMFDVVLYRSKRPDIDIAVGLPDGFTTYLSLAARVSWFKEVVPFTLYWVSADGGVREQ